MRLRLIDVVRGMLLAALALPLAAWSHGDWPPQHGGVMNVGGETSFELVQRRAGVHFHVSDHGEVLSTTGSKATLSVKRARKEKTFDGKPRGESELFFPKAKVTEEDNVQVRVTFGNGSVALGRFPARSQQTNASIAPINRLANIDGRLQRFR
ncbi:hypothetical protein J2W37_000656 [Variovorax paradoxus]|uniref:hypothetical protein n=1 Tax=Variovorax paradoxus TaxID=34073 RepID=UPI00277F643E|nr:hypothetical protein [Variovorax paradoxus]MDP9962950.1 hypothetical protein [Variovorax paradoxus]